MKIHTAEMVETDGAISVRYPFETPSRAEQSGTLWFSVAEQWRDWLYTGPEPAIAALVFLAMVLGEDIEVVEPVSPRFHYGLHRAVEHFHLWWPSLRPVVLRAPGYSSARQARATAVASCFSGGVDSFHTLYAHLDGTAQNPDCRLTHLFFAHGFDIPLTAPTYREIAAEFGELARSLGLELIGLATNARAMLDPHLKWDQTHGACIAASALLLSGGIRRFITPSTNRQSLLFLPCGSNPITDPMFGTESLELVHYGTHLSRIEKVVALAERREAHEHLRVCWQNVPGQRNCGRCVKCLKTMMPLAILGVLEQFSVFPPLPPWNAIDGRCFAPVDLSGATPEVSYTEELRALAASRGFTGLPRRRIFEQSARTKAKMVARAIRKFLQ